jgi:hypothetical protein
MNYQSADVLPIIEDNARLERAENNAEPLFMNENARREEALKSLAADQAERAKDSDEDLSADFAVEREKVLTDTSVYPPEVDAPTFEEKKDGAKKASAAKSKDTASV